MGNQTGNNPEDKALVKQVLSGNTNAFRTVIKNTEGLVAQVVFKLIPNTEDRKDIVQDIYMKAFHKLNGFKFQSKLGTWVAQIAYNTCLNWIERKKLVFPGDLGEENESNMEIQDSKSPGLSNHADAPLMQKELSDILVMETGNLPPLYQTLITLYHKEELSYADIVQITGLPEGTVKNYLFRARKMLKENLLSKYKKEAL